MESYDNCHGPSKDAAQLLEMRITVAPQTAEQVLESHVVDQIRGGSTLALGGKKRWHCFLLDLEKVTQDIDCVKRKAMEVQQARSGLELLKQPTTAYSSSSRHDPPLTSEKTSMVGFDDLLLQLLDVLTGTPSSRRVISIVGTGGVGKTTLALNAFHHPLIVQHFDVCLWATISQQYVFQDTLSTLVYYGQGQSNCSETIGELGDKLHKRLYGRRYLIVLDDMWSVTTWDEMKFFFPDTNNGSRIVVTTRQSDVANYTGSASSLSVSLLDDDKSWDLFCEKAFVGGEGCPPELEDIGKRIVRKCRGLPLAIVVRKENVANDDMMSVLNSEENKQFLNVLSFSYSHLLVHLKPCFVYMGTFPEDEEINVRELVILWIAEGFVKSCKGDNLEEIAEDYLKDLIDRNLIISHSEFYCKIHDVLRELCLKVAEKEMLFYVVGGGVCKERRVGNRGIFDAQRSAPPLVRCLKLRRSGTEQSLFDLRLCRLLFKEVEGKDVINRGLIEVDLQHVNLRYLHYKLYEHDIRGLSDLFLPSSISLFWNLQTLIIREADSLTIIAPNEIWEMIQLRHLEVDGSIKLPDPATANANDEGLIMRNLHTLLGVENLKLIEVVCKRVANVKDLCVEFSGGRPSDYCPHNLGCLRKLESLDLRIFDTGAGWREFVLSLTFPNSLKKLQLEKTGVEWEEMTMMVGSLPHLETLVLGYKAVIGSEWKLVGEGKFLRLKSLSVFGCSDLVTWNAENSHFPVLEQLHLCGVPRLDEFPSDIGNIPTLNSIKLINCSASLTIYVLRMVVEQEEENGNDSLKLYVTYLSKSKEFEMFNKKVDEEGLTSNNLFLNKR